jgi:hypothetical protein
VPRRLPRQFTIRDAKPATATLLETRDKLGVNGGTIIIPDALRDKLPERVAYTIRLTGV